MRPRLLMHILAPRLHLVRYFGHYAHVSRARRGRGQLVRRIYQADPLLCTCGAQMRILSFITEPPVVRKILEHLQRTRTDPARGPPGVEAEPAALVS